MTPPLLVPTRVVAASLDVLQEAGRLRRECVVLWLSRRGENEINVVEAYRPEQVTAEDYFQLPRASITALFDVLRTRKLMVAAQVHTHPEQAFHSVADDKWAIVRHVNALSLVLPYFAMNTRASSFLADSAIFMLSRDNAWREVPRPDVPRHVREVP